MVILLLNSTCDKRLQYPKETHFKYYFIYSVNYLLNSVWFTCVDLFAPFAAIKILRSSSHLLSTNNIVCFPLPCTFCNFPWLSPSSRELAKYLMILDWICLLRNLLLVPYMEFLLMAKNAKCTVCIGKQGLWCFHVPAVRAHGFLCTPETDTKLLSHLSIILNLSEPEDFQPALVNFMSSCP